MNEGDDSNSDNDEEDDEETPKKVNRFFNYVDMIFFNCICKLYFSFSILNTLISILKPEVIKKRPNESASKTPVSSKKAKVASPKSGNA